MRIATPPAGHGADDPQLVDAVRAHRAGCSVRTHDHTHPGSIATRRRFLAGTVGAAAAVALGGLTAAPAGAALPATSGDGEGEGDVAETETPAETPEGSGEAEEATPAGRVVTLPAYVSRGGWGAEEAWGYTDDGASTFPVVFGGVQKITVHHTATITPWSQDAAAELIRSIHHEHAVELGFGDIGYHLLIDPEGVVYEGRYSGGTRFPVYDVRPGDGVPGAVVAAHTKGYNVGNIGIALLGDLDEHTITDAAWWSLVTTIALVCVNTELDPLGRTQYVNPVNGFVIDSPNVGGHRHYAGTACPGDAMMGWMPELRSEVAAAAAQLPRRAWLA